MNYFILLTPVILMACASTQRSGKSLAADGSEIIQQRAVANDEGYTPDDEVLYKKLAIKEENVSRGANSIRFQKQVGRLTCVKVLAKSDNVIVGYECALQENINNGYDSSDELIFNALNSKEVPFMRGANSIRTQKNAGNLSCSKVATRSSNVVVGYECNM